MRYKLHILLIWICLITISYPLYSQESLRIKVKSIQREFLKEKIINKRSSKKITHLLDNFSDKEVPTNKEVVNIFFTATKELPPERYPSWMEAEEVEYMIHLALNDTTGVYTGNHLSIPLPNSMGAFWLGIDRKDIIERQKQFVKAAEILSKEQILSHEEEDKLKRSMNETTIMFAPTFFKLCLEEMR